MNSSPFYPEEFVREVKELFPENEGLHEALDWGRPACVDHHLTELLEAQTQALNDFREKFCEEDIFGLTSLLKVESNTLAEFCSGRRDIVAALQKKHDDLKEPVIARTAHFPQKKCEHYPATAIPPQGSNIVRNRSRFKQH